MRVTRLRQKVHRALARGGLRELVRLGFKQLRPRAQAVPEPLSELDRRYGIDTSGRIDQLDLDTRTFSNWIHGTRYQASDAGLLSKLVVATKIRPADYTLVDLGCGKGRMLFSAIETGFAKAVGVEFSTALLRIAADNTRVFHQMRAEAEIELHHADAAEFDLPDGNVVVYLYNPFDAWVMAAVAHRTFNQCKCRNGRLWIWYHNPKYASCWDEAGFGKIADLQSLATTVWSNQ